MKKIYKLIIIIVLLTLICLGFYYILKGTYDNKVYSVVDTYAINYKYANLVGNGLIEVSDGEKVGFMNDKGKLIVDLKYDYQEYNHAYKIGGYIGLRQKDKFILFDRTGKVVLSDYDQVYNDSNYLIASKGDSTTIFDNKLNKIFYSENTGYTYIDNNYIIEPADDIYNIYDINGKLITSGEYVTSNSNFIVIKKDDKYEIHFALNKKTLLVERYSFSKDLILVKQDKYKLYDINGKLIKTLPNNDKKLYLSDNNLVLNFYEMNNDNKGNIYDLDGKIIVDKIESLQDSTKDKIIVKTNDKCIYYKDNKKIKTFKNCNYAYFSNNEYIIINNDNSGNVYDIDGKLLLKNVETIFTYNNYYFLGYKNGLYNVTDKKFDVIGEYYRQYFKLAGGLIVEKPNGRYGILDNKLNELVESKYSECSSQSNLALCTFNNKYELNVIKYMSKKELKNYKAHKVIYKDNNNINTEDVIKEYELSSIKDTIYENEPYFKKYASAVINNDKLNNYKSNVLLLFKLVMDQKEYFDLDTLVNNIGELSITYYDTKPDNMTSYAVGEYYNNDLSISLIVKQPRVVYHELLHFLQFNKNRQFDYFGNYVCNCNGKYMSYQDMIKLDVEDIKLCKTTSFYANAIEESSAEVNTTKYFTNGVPEVYLKETQVFEILEYIFGTDYMDEVSFSNNRFYKLFTGFNEYLNWDIDRYNEFLNNFQELNDIDLNYKADMKESYALYKVTDDLIDLYKAVKKSDWQDDVFMKASIRFLLFDSLNHNTVYSNLEKYLKDNNKTINHLDELTIDNLSYKDDITDKYDVLNARIIIGNTNSNIKTNNAIIYRVFRNSDYAYGDYYEYYNGTKLDSTEFREK